MRSEDYFRYGGKLTPKILKNLGISNFEYSRIDGDYIIKIKMTNYDLINNLKSYFNLYLLSIINDEIPIVPSYFNLEKNERYLKIIDFSSDRWKDITYLQMLRKEKLKKLNSANYV